MEQIKLNMTIQAETTITATIGEIEHALFFKQRDFYCRQTCDVARGKVLLLFSLKTSFIFCERNRNFMILFYFWKVLLSKCFQDYLR